MALKLHSRIVAAHFLTILAALLIFGYLMNFGMVQRQFAIALLLAGLFAAVVGTAMRRMVSTPLRNIAEASHQLAIGNLEYRVPEAGDDDFAIVSSSLNRMAGSLNQKMIELGDDKQRFESIVMAMSAGVVLFDNEGRALMANPSAQGLLGVQGAIGGRSVMELVRHPGVQLAVQESLAGKDPQPVDIETLTGRVLSAKAAPVSRRSGKADLVVVTFHDLTETKRVEKMRREFVANVSHEFKTPLTSIKGYTETLLHSPNPDPALVREFLDVIHRNAMMLQGLIEDVLVLATLERDFPVQREGIDVRSLIEEQLSVRRSILDESGIKVEIDCPEEELPADRVRLTRAISNLLDNAIHYNKPNGGITFFVRRLPPYWKIEVRDTGIGIPGAELPRIFERFYRVDKSRSRNSGGTGLGLAIVKHAIESQGGTVSVTSRPGVGSTFAVKLPLA